MTDPSQKAGLFDEETIVETLVFHTLKCRIIYGNKIKNLKNKMTA